MLSRTPLIAMSVLVAMAGFAPSTATAGERAVRIARKQTTRKVVTTTKTVTRRVTPAPVHREHEYRNARRIAYRPPARSDCGSEKVPGKDLPPLEYRQASARYDDAPRHVQPVSHRSHITTSVQYSSGYYDRPRHYYRRPVRHYPRRGHHYGHRRARHGGHSGWSIGVSFRF